MNEEFGYEPENNNKKIALIAGAAVLLLAVGVGAAVYLRSRQQAVQDPSTAPTNSAMPTNQAVPSRDAAEVPFDGTSGYIVDIPGVEYGKVYEATTQEKLEWGFAAGDRVTYTWTKPTEGHGSVQLISGPTAASQPDADRDGLSDADEVKYGTDSKNPDSDGDGLLDGTEVNQMHTDPKKPDAPAKKPTP